MNGVLPVQKKRGPGFGQPSPHDVFPQLNTGTNAQHGQFYPDRAVKAIRQL